MSTRNKSILAGLGIIASILMAVIAIVKAGAAVVEPYTVLPDRVLRLEQKVHDTSLAASRDHDLLTRIDERIGRIDDSVKTLVKHELNLVEKNK